MGWGKQMRSAFGTSFLWLVILIYFTQGFRSFVWTAVSYQMKDMLKLSPSASQFVVSVAYFPWSIKPFYGILSDCFPIRQKKRKPYLIIATILSLFPWLVLGLKTSLRSARNPLTFLLTLQNLGTAMADVVIDAMIAEAVRAEKAEFSGDLQSLSWSTMALGGIFGSLLGGYTLSNLRIDTIFLLFSILPIIQLVSCALIEEAPSEILKVADQNQSEESEKEVHAFSKSSIETSESQTTRRRKARSTKGKQKAISMKSETSVEKPSSLPAKWHESLKSAIYTLCRAFRQPIIIRPMAWFFFSHITVPNLSTAMFYYQTEVLHLEASFLGTARVIGWFGLMLGTYTYNRYLKRMKLRKILMFAHIGLATVKLLDILLVSRSSTQFGIPDNYLVLGGSAVGDAINQFKLMPFLILSGQLCPPGIEGTLFALFMSINNFGNTLSSFFGAALASALNISSESFDNLLYGLTVELFCTIIPVGFLFLIPKEATGLTSQE
ncbi:putative folate-biopterin transporter 4 [Iris pallida]|uniref:Folate-biopterin transporter 4 n=1 Tax=Iris pallida TaxID=29817 RepID=A0AAX6DJS4_IRIPA|nr:putative folate-biopterin transporter 4 [Iris pallida]